MKPPPVDIICGGFPCQDISNAGKRAGIDGERSGLWSEFARIIRVLRPRVVFVENVAALASRGLDRVLGDLASLGFDAEWEVFRASDVGAPHIRARLFILAYANRIDGWLQQGRRNGSCWTDSAIASNDGAALSLADANGERKLQPRGGVANERRRPGDGGEQLADAKGDRRVARRAGDAEEVSRGWESDRGGVSADDVANAHGAGQIGARNTDDRVRNEAAGYAPQPNDGRRDSSVGFATGWPAEPDVGRVAHGVPARVHRLRLLGNACVPAQAALAWQVLSRRAFAGRQEVVG